MKTHIIKKMALRIVIALTFFSAGCGAENEAGTGVGNPPATSTKAAAAVVAVFLAVDSDQNVSAAMTVRSLRRAETRAEGEGGPGAEQCAENDPACTCTSGEDGGPAEVETVLFGVAGVFGSMDFSLSVDEGDYCRSEGGAVNGGSGPDGDGLVAAFTITENIPVICDGDDSEIDMGAGSTGIFRNTTADQTGTAYRPQVFGSFVFTVDGAPFTIDCTIFMDGSENILFSDCSDADGIAIDLDADSSCAVDASE